MVIKTFSDINSPLTQLFQATKQTTDKQQEVEEKGNYIHFFSVNWCSRHDFPTPISPKRHLYKNIMMQNLY